VAETAKRKLLLKSCFQWPK